MNNTELRNKIRHAWVRETMREALGCSPIVYRNHMIGLLGKSHIEDVKDYTESVQELISAARQNGWEDQYEIYAVLILAQYHTDQIVRWCNGELTTDACERITDRMEKAIVSILTNALETEVTFYHDPRGATVKFTFPNGRSNSFVGSMWCVPTIYS